MGFDLIIHVQDCRQGRCNGVCKPGNCLPQVSWLHYSMATTTLRPLKFFNGHVLDTAVTPKRSPCYLSYSFYFILLLYYFPRQKKPFVGNEIFICIIISVHGIMIIVPHAPGSVCVCCRRWELWWCTGHLCLEPLESPETAPSIRLF